MAEIGSTLREARMRARIDISEVEASTKIRAKYLRAIENEEWDLLPGTVYVKSFLKTYGDYLGLDSRLLIDEFKRRYERPSDHELRPIASLGRERERTPRGPLIPRWAVFVVVFVAIGGALYAIGTLANPNKSPTNVPSAGNGGGGGTDRGGHHHHPSTTTTTTPTTRTATTPVVPTSARVQITPTSTVWICIENGSHTAVFPAGDFTVGQKVPIAKGSVLLVTLGNAGVSLKINGHHYPLTASSSAIGLRVTPTRISHLTSGLPTCS
jgi:cytoskeletal protein RodZ